MNVTLQSASGRQVMIRTHAGTSDAAACRAALKEARETHGDLGWLVLVVQ